MRKNVETSSAIERKQVLVPKGVDDNEFSLSDMYDPRSTYTVEQKMQAAMAMVMTNNSKQACKLSGVNAATIRWWKTEAAWWPDAINHCRKQKNDDVDAAITNIIDKSLEKYNAILEEGEEVLHPKTGEKIRKQPSLRDLATSTAILFDKRSHIRGESIGTGAKADQNEILIKLMQKFEALAVDIKSKKDPRVISEQ